MFPLTTPARVLIEGGQKRGHKGAGVERINSMVRSAADEFLVPRPAGDEVPPEAVAGWLSTWKTMLQIQVDGLIAMVEDRAAVFSAAGSSTGNSTNSGDGLVFSVALVGDSTMRMQAQLLVHLLSTRLTLDGRPQCITAVKSDHNTEARCTGGSPSADPERVVLRFKYTHVVDSCSRRGIIADFVYFGCGLHLLQLIPDREMPPQNLHTWVHYQRALGEAVELYRSGGTKKHSREPLGIAFMMTHSFFDDALTGDYKTRTREYREKKEPLMTDCREKVKAIRVVHPSWPNDEYQPEDICDFGTFDDAGVKDLNRRAETVMMGLGVPMIKNYDFTHGQSWATTTADGRHYPFLVPMELASFMSEVSGILREERRTTRSAVGPT